MNFLSQTFLNDITHGYRPAILNKNSLWLLPFYMVMATYFYNETVRRATRTATVLNLLKLTILIFWTKLAQNICFRFKTKK